MRGADRAPFASSQTRNAVDQSVESHSESEIVDVLRHPFPIKIISKLWRQEDDTRLVTPVRARRRQLVFHFHHHTSFQ